MLGSLSVTDGKSEAANSPTSSEPVLQLAPVSALSLPDAGATVLSKANRAMALQENSGGRFL